MSDDARIGTDEGIERRRFLKGAATVAWATPLILTMTAHQAGAQAMSCLPNGGACDSCFGMPCCDEDGEEDGGCCCSDALVEGCAGICVAVDADCDAMNLTPATEFTCWVPFPEEGLGARAGVMSGSKGPKPH